MKKSFKICFLTVSTAMLIILSGCKQQSVENKQPVDMSPGYTLAAYYWPNHHVDKRNEAHLGKGWTEWDLIKNAKPRWKGHNQPLVPLWGYQNEDDPAVMKNKIDAAADNGIDAFIVDWYYYNDGPFLNSCLDSGILKAPNVSRIKFGIMWANHDYVDIFPNTSGDNPPLLYPGEVTIETFRKMTDIIIEKYFKSPSYWLVDGCPYFSIYELFRFVNGCGGYEKAKAELDLFRKKTKEAGFPDLYLNVVMWGIPNLPRGTTISDPVSAIKYLGFNSVTDYTWIHFVPLPTYPETPYQYVMEKGILHWYESNNKYNIPYFPNVSMAWDPTCRSRQDIPHDQTKGYGSGATISGNTPEAFKKSLMNVRYFLEKHPSKYNIITINSWNEWSEGSHLEPDVKYGMKFLEAVKEVFNPDNDFLKKENKSEWLFIPDTTQIK